MSCAVTIPGVDAIFFLTAAPDDREGLEVEEGAWVEVPPNIGLWSGGADDHRQTLCRSISDARHYKIFRGDRDVAPADFEPTGMGFGGTFSPASWGRFARGIPALRAFHAIPDTEPPGPAEVAERLVRGAR